MVVLVSGNLMDRSNMYDLLLQNPAHKTAKINQNQMLLGLTKFRQTVVIFTGSFSVS